MHMPHATFQPLSATVAVGKAIRLCHGDPMNKNLLSAETHFEFGQNWADYANRIGDAEANEAKRALLRLVNESEFKGASFLDIGSGSGIHSLAAHMLGVSSITAIDIDKESVETTRKTLEKFGVSARVECKSIFDKNDLGQFDIVYSWGVLHHTGDMWTAVRNAAAYVKPGGLFVIALYQKTPLCGAWVVEKRLYTAAPPMLRKMASGVFGTVLLAAKSLRGHNPVAHVRNYRNARGMSFWHDIHDWLGGYPYESSTPQETATFVTRLGFEPVTIGDLKPGLGVFGTGCAEYVFRRLT